MVRARNYIYRIIPNASNEQERVVEEQDTPICEKISITDTYIQEAGKESYPNPSSRCYGSQESDVHADFCHCGDV